MAELMSPPGEFHGGLHLADNKALSNQHPSQTAPLPRQLVLPLQQHIGSPAEALVGIGDKVLKGQLIAQANDYVSANIHAPTSGTITHIGDRPIPHPSALNARCIVLETDGEDRWIELPAALPDYRELDAGTLGARIRWAGIVGLGGATFPTSVKLNSAKKPVETLIINAAECEPYITCDDLLMREHADEVIEGASILRHMAQATHCIIGIEDNKPQAIESLQLALDNAGCTEIRICVVPTKYPSGGEKQLIKLLTDQEVPSGGRPMDIGMLCQNVATAVSVAQAVLQGRPLISRLVTVTGQGVHKPGNFEVLIGTPAAEVIDLAGGYNPQAKRLILGGPMMGFALDSDQLPTTKAVNCYLVANAEEAPDPEPASPCIRCGECMKACPANLLPQQLYWHARARELDKAQEYKLFDCIECGCCAQVCPAHIPLVQYYRYAKTEIWAAERERNKSDLARRRHDARGARQERLKAERKARMRKKKEALENKPKAKTDAKKSAIEAAMKRVAEKKAAQQQTGQVGE